MDCCRRFGLAVLPLAAADATGRWQLKGEVAGNPILADCNFKQDAAKLAGTCKAEGMSVWNVAGEIQEKKISFHYDVDYAGSTYTLNYSGAFESDTVVKGDIESGGASGEFTLTKAAAEEPKKETSTVTIALSGSWKIDVEVGGETHSSTCSYPAGRREADWQLQVGERRPRADRRGEGREGELDAQG